MRKPREDPPGWRTVSEETKYADAYLQVTLQEVFTPTRADRAVKWTVVHRKAAVVIAPVTPEGKFVLVRQERIPIRAVLWEFPAGQIDEEDAADEAVVRATVVRELREETGYEMSPAGDLVKLGHFFTSQGFTDECNQLFLATGVVVSKAGAAPDEGESITDCREFTMEELRRMVAEGEINNSSTLSLYARLCARGLV